MRWFSILLWFLTLFLRAIRAILETSVLDSLDCVNPVIPFFNGKLIKENISSFDESVEGIVYLDDRLVKTNCLYKLIDSPVPDTIKNRFSLLYCVFPESYQGYKVSSFEKTPVTFKKSWYLSLWIIISFLLTWDI